MIDYKDAIKQVRMPKEVIVYNGCNDPCDVLIGWLCVCGGGHSSAKSTVDKLAEIGYNITEEHLIALSLYRRFLSR